MTGRPRPKKSTPLQSWRVYKIRSKMQELGMVFARSQDEAIKLAFEEYKVQPHEQKRIIVRREE